MGEPFVEKDEREKEPQTCAAVEAVRMVVRTEA